MSNPVLKAEEVTVNRGGTSILDSVSISVDSDTSMLVRGPSGSGKTTLFNTLGLLSTPTSGRIYIQGADASELSERKRASIRRDTIGFVFQDFQLIPDLTAWDNAALPQDHTGSRNEDWLAELFDVLNITELREKYPATLSGGEKQRVAIARALANYPPVILADEPTGQLDPQTAEQVLDLLFEVQAETDTALVLISHDRGLSSRFAETVLLRDGKVTDDMDDIDYSLTE
ncbi:MAG: ABC-type antimicrobial peptide transport system, ATPase component [Haloquadratum walsbyi J07HQW1]|jgi:ABC-type antimicrobial peptide transport system, ATPase component|uniref:ABC-type antimicrobial peptide transport system, ATPase component n=1 Tax=Haloquadratum walsbyi J07HQW1 TaxID=1238424 RepID=U1N0L3_9EURY|nr:MAG: ABC-type antimicrobial peptide transport system, ATPase component [Haloquadratum walsbyi J07HQW1]